MADPLIIETADLRKRYDDVEALAGLSLQVPKGSICGLLGRNGAGKTTTIKVLLGMTRPTAGTASVFGLPADDAESSLDIRRRTAFVSDEKDLYDAMSVEQMIRFTARLYPHWRSDLEQEYLRKFELPADRIVKKLSRGTRTKLALLLALCSGAELLILDEPTSGLDPAVTEEVLQALVAHVARQEMTVFLSSHQLADVEQIADHIAIIERGRARRPRRARRHPRELPADSARVRRRRAGARLRCARHRRDEATGAGAHSARSAGARIASSTKRVRSSPCPWTCSRSR